ncbi:cytoplasmic 60S subunit biogenesis factor ZNF622 [Spea bombifrons]|uniref:cytoplasmic 60S subunit biogenesis factor ZNF622 n=1 Tax=Spea bombifrons TaxID=233779 RepID=UPI0023496243|nr:cytoplasmic 60S subunit biogenesis factor ZNF622 [Spea bombifrons]XP_053322290.1 cytoplasmic 60S subunit biogenesis factor ZNF622 [Spea bombifrons]
MASYTCITCRVAFADPDVQRSHYKTDWHRYNLKRKVADMPSVTAENFQERVLAQRAVVEEQSKETATYCTVCSKRFSTFNAYENHLKSKKHLDLEKKAAQAITKKVEMLNEKNLEKGLVPDCVDKDAMNTAIQQAIKPQPCMSPKKKANTGQEGGIAPSAEKQESHPKIKPEKPPRLQWYEQQAKRMQEAESQAMAEIAEVEDGGWEDMDSEEEEEDVDSDEEMEDVVGGEEGSLSTAENVSLPGAIPITDCLFCGHHSRSLMKNVAHMTKVHSFFIPDIEYLQDLQGLIAYLGEKIGVGKICLWCNEKGKSFYTTESVQAHMNDKSHCKLFTDGDAALEFADFYDFRTSYPDHKDGEDVEMLEKELPGDKNMEYDEDTMELVLPSGARVGHRSLMRYYKQNFGVSRELVVSRNQKAVGRVLQQYKALGWTGGTGSYLQCGRDMKYIQKMKSKWMLKTGMSNNATKQMHFRCQVMF